MNLNMYVGDHLIESIPLDKERISKPGYVGNFKRNLKVKYKELFSRGEQPEFFVINPDSRIQPHQTQTN